MQVTYRVHNEGLGLTGFAKQNAFAFANAINRTLDEGQAAQRAGIHSRFVLRGRAASFIDRLVKRRREDFARKDRIVGRLRIEGPEGDRGGRGAILARHEEGGTRTTGGGGGGGVADRRYRMRGFFFLPTSVLRSTFSTTVPRKMYPAHLSGAASTGTWNRGSAASPFVLFAKGKPVGIFQRNAGELGRATSRQRGQRDPTIRMLWSFQRQITLKPRLEFLVTQERTIGERFPLNYRGMLAQAIRTSR